MNFLVGCASSLNLFTGWGGKSKPFRGGVGGIRNEETKQKKGRKLLAQRLQYFRLHGTHLEYWYSRLIIQVPCCAQLKGNNLHSCFNINLTSKKHQAISCSFWDESLFTCPLFKMFSRRFYHFSGKFPTYWMSLYIDFLM